jgi:UDP-3-O-[3-hydroxymyristoyl] N-acetylglucosamine deacetylase
MYRQRTLKSEVAVTGVGLHSGRRVTLTLKPGAADSGVRFVRTDGAARVEIPATVESVVDTTLATTLGRGGTTVGTVEHLLAALYGMGIDNVVADVDGPEIPALDGSAEPFVEMMRKVGIARQEAPKTFFVIDRPVRVEEPGKWAELVPARGLSIEYRVHFNHQLLGEQKMSVDLCGEDFSKVVAPARTFGFAKEVDALRARGLALGGSLENAVVLDGDHYLNPDGLRFADECVRHKVLDAIGDLALFGMSVVGRFRADRSGHTLNNRLARAVLADAASHRKIRPTSDEAKALGLFVPAWVTP